MKNILFTTYHYYPSAAVGAKRVAKFCKYLQRRKFKPILLTVKPENYEARDDHLKVAWDKVYRTGTLQLTRGARPRSLFRRPWYYMKRAVEKSLFPDKYIGWLPFALARAVQIFRKNRVDVIYASGPWFSSFLIAYFLHKIYKRPLVVEYRDQWSLNVVYHKSARSAWHRYWDKKILRAADGIVFVSNSLLKQYRTAFPDVDFDKAIVIPNSFDPEEFDDLKPAQNGDALKMTYAGNFYWPRTPDTFLQALHQLTTEGKIRDGEFKFINIGNLDTSVLNRYNFNGLVEVRGTLPHRQTLEQLAASDWLLLIVSKGHEANIPAKLYEYLAVGKPIFALCPEGAEAKEIIEETQSGIVANVEDVAEIKEGIHRIYRNGRNNFHPVKEKLNGYNIFNTTHRLSQYLSKIG